MSTSSRRWLGVTLYALCLGVLFLTGFLVIYGEQYLNRGIAYGPPPRIPLANVYPYGVNVALEQYTPAQREQVLDRLSQDGFRWLRQVLPWDRIEARRGEYAWSPWDQILDDVARRDLKLILVLDRTPAWARTAPDTDPRALPANPADLAEFVSAVAERYSGQISALEIWREPNLQTYRTVGREAQAGPSPAQYVAHLQAAYTAAKAVDPALTVLNAGLAPTTENSPRAMSDVQFLREMYDAGAAPYFDALAARPLGFWSDPDDERVQPDVLNFSRVLLLRDVMAEYGDTGKAVWAVEFGWNALPADWTGPPSPWGTDDPAKQAQRTVDAVRRAQTEWPWMGPLLVLHLDPAAPPDDPIQGFALLDENLAPRPTYLALRDLIAEHRVGVGRYPADAWFVGSDWAPAEDATARRAPDGEIIVSRRSLFNRLPLPPLGRLYLVLGLLLATAGIVTWRLDRLARLPRWDLAFAVIVAIFLASPWLPVLFTTLLVLLGLFALRLDLGLATIVLLIPFFRFAKTFDAQPISVLELFTWLALAAWSLRQLLGVIRAPSTLRHAPRFTALDYAVAGLVLISLISPIVAENTGVAIRELRVVVIDSAIFYALVRFSRWSRSEFWRLADALVLAGLLVALYGFFQYLVSGDVIVAEGVRRMRSVYPSPNNLSLFLGRIVPLAGVVALDGAVVSWRRRFYAGAGLVITAALFLTFSRAAWLVGLPAAILFVGLARGRRTLRIAVAALLALGLSVLPFAGTARMRSLFELSPGSSTYRRLKLWQASLHMIRDHPIFGVGLDNFLYQYRATYVLPGAQDDPSLSHPHNVILGFWTRLGILGVGVLLWLVVAFFRAGWELYNRIATGGKPLVLGLMASMVYTLAHGMLDNSYFLIDLAYVFMLTLGIVSNLSSESR